MEPAKKRNKTVATTGEEQPVISTTIFKELDDGTKISYRATSPPPGLYSVGWRGECNVARDGFDSITTEHVRQYAKLGFLVVEKAFTVQEVEDALAAIELYCSEADTPFAAAAAASTATPDDGPNGRAGPGIQFESSAGSLPRGMRAKHVRKLQNWHEFDERLKILTAEGSKLRHVVSTLIGHGVEIFQSTALLKPPGGREKPWHQDHAYFNVPMERSPTGALTTVLGCWLALDLADEGNGCMFVQPGLDKLVPAVHWQRRDWQMCDDQIVAANTLAVPLQPGSLLFFSSLLPHGTPPNASGRPRRALQWHFVPRDCPRIPDATRQSIFGSEGKAVEC